MNALQKLYPHLKFNRVPAPTQLVMPSIAKPMPKPTYVPQPAPAPVQEPIILAPIAPEPIEPEPMPQPELVPQEEPVPDPEPIAIAATPAPKPAPKRPAAKRAVATTRGKTLEEKKAIYLNRLSKQSNKKAELEIAGVEQVLKEANGDPELLRQREQEVKKELKLINYSKFFSNTDTENVTPNDIN